MKYILKHIYKAYTLTLFAFAVLVITTISSNAQNIVTSDPKVYAEKLKVLIVEIIESKDSEDIKEQKLVALFHDNVDHEWMGRFVIGKYFREMNDKVKADYLASYRDYVIYSYVPKFREYEGENIEIGKIISEGQDEYTIKSKLKTKKVQSGEVFVDFRARKNGNTFKLIDVIGEGVSLLASQRSDFSTPVSQMGVEEFTKKLGQKVEKLKASKPSNRKSKESSEDKK